ncbi:MAG: ribbon-helix-helix domain-containing protein [Cyclobacteriaceae bacterium]|jgi:metal-responsive CopG/Arc/MetJ family transcriptional regulator|nr:ribbon-helix-helix domain-containing protein [Flammeovirgaceae bacterium]
MAPFTSTLPDDLLKKLAEKSNALEVPRNQIIERAVRLYLEHLERAEYIKSYRTAGSDTEIMGMAEEGMADYLRQIES